MKRKIERLIYWTILVAIGLGFAHAVLGEEFAPSEYQQTLHELAQGHRVTNGRELQTLDPECCAIAQKWAETMAARQSMTHGGGEQIIAYGYATPVAAVRVWINSPPHNGWLLSSTKKAGWGAAQSRVGTWYWAGAFRESTAPTTDGGSYDSGRRWFRFFRR